MGMWQGILQGMQLNEERKRLAKKEQMDEEDRQLLRQKYSQQLFDSRLKTVLELRKARAERLPQESEYSSQLMTIKSRLGDYADTEEGKRWYNTLRLNPALSEEILSGIAEAEKESSEKGVERNIRGEDFVNAFELLSDFNGDPDVLRRFVDNGGDALEAIISGGKDITTEEGYMEVLSSLTAPVPAIPTVALEISPEIYQGVPEARFKQQVEILDNRTLEIAEQERARLMAAAETAETDTERQEFTTQATAINNAINDFEDNPTRLREMNNFGAQAYLETMEEGTDFFSLAQENPYLRPYQNIVKALDTQTTAEQTPTFATEAEAEAAYRNGLIKDGDEVIIAGQRGRVGR